MRPHKHFASALFVATFSLAMSAQAQSTPDLFTPFTTCSVPGGPAITEAAPLAPGLAQRTIKTRRGSTTISLIDGRTVTFTYPSEEPFAHVKVETVLPGNYDQVRSALLDNFEYVLSSGENRRNEKLPSRLNGFAIQGFDRLKREGSVLGFYLLLDDATHTVLTIDFLNPDQIKSMEEYASRRDRFLNAYTACIRDKQ